MTDGASPTAAAARPEPDAVEPSSGSAGHGKQGSHGGTRRAVIWEAAPAQEGLVALLRRRALEPERVESAPAAVLAVMRPGPPAAALILVDPGSLPRAAEAVEAVRRHAPQTRCWSFHPAPVGSVGAGSLQPVEGPLRLRGSRIGGVGNVAVGREVEAAGPAAGTRLSRAELSMLLGPTRTLRSPAGDAG